MSSDEDVSPKKQRRVERKKKIESDDDYEEEGPSTSRKRGVKGEGEKKKNESKKKDTRKIVQPDIHVDAAFEPSDEESDSNDSLRPTTDFVGGDLLDEEESARLRRLDYNEEDIFIIPSRDDDLLIRPVGYRIAREKLTCPEGAVACIEAFEDEILSGRWRCLYERFPLLFNIVRSPTDNDEREEVSPAMKCRLANSLILAYGHMSKRLKSVLNRAVCAEQPKKNRLDCHDMADHLLMLLYLFYRLTTIFEDEAKSNKRRGPKKGRGRGKKRAVQNDEGDMLSGGDEDLDGTREDENSWEDTRCKLIETLIEICNTTVVNKENKTCEGAIRFLWKTGNVDQSMIRCMLDTGLKFFDNPDVTRPQSKGILTSVFKLFRTMAITFNYFGHMGSMIFVKLTSLDYYKEGSATAYPFLERIKAVAVEDRDTDKLFDNMLKYFSMNPVSVSNNNAKALCLFMSNITELEPYKVFLSIQPFVGLLTDENASVRSTVLNVITTLLCQDFLDSTRGALPDTFTKSRNHILDRLLQHVRDVNANVRASALKCLTALAKMRKLPSEVIKEGLVQLVGQRIGDDKVAVRKEAIRFAIVFLQNNPYGHDFEKSVNEKALKDALQKRDKLRAQNVGSDPFNQAEESYNRIRSELEAEVTKCVEEYILGIFVPTTIEERKKMHREFEQRNPKPQSNDGVSKEQAKKEISFRDLFMSLLSEEREYSVPARLLLSMAISGELRAENVTEESLIDCKTSELMTQHVIDAGHHVFLALASNLFNQDDEKKLRKEQDDERRNELIAKLSKDIKDLLIKLVLEKELAECLPPVMTSVMCTDGDLKLGIDFVVKCKEFNITGSEAAVRQLCALVWKSDDEGRQQILQAASAMFISSNPDMSIKVSTTCENILNLVKSMSDHERGSVQQVLNLTTKIEPIPIGVYNELWKQVDEDNITANDSPAVKRKRLIAMKALCLLSSSDIERNRRWLRRYQHIVKVGSPELAAEALGCIANLATSQAAEEQLPLNAPSYRIPGNDSLFHVIQQFMLAELCREEARTWNRSLRFTLDIYFHICKHTTDVVTKLVAKMLWLLRRTSQALHFYDMQSGMEEILKSSQQRQRRSGIDGVEKEIEKEEVSNERSEYLTRLWSVILERICVMAGEIAVRLYVHTDLVMAKQLLKTSKRMSSSDAFPFPNRPMHPWESRCVLQQGIFAWAKTDPTTIDMTGVTEGDRVHVKSGHILEYRVMKKHLLLGRLLPILVHSVRAKGSPPRVRFQAVQALAKFMIVSPDVAQKSARIFFSYLNNAPSPILRSNLLVVAADLTSRHPNLVENNAASLFSLLHDTDSCVRETCMLVLNHLITNDLIKTHGVLSYALTGYVDDVPSIRHITSSMFTEWCKKEGVMSHVPDFISRLSRDSKEVPLASFKIIMDHFLGRIRQRKEGQNNIIALVEKLCKRFEFAKSPRVAARNPDMPAYYSHCLRIFPLNAKSFHKMVDCLENYKQFLGDDRVYEDISTIVKTFQKEDLKANQGHSDIADDVSNFITKLAELHEQHKTETEVEGKIAKMTFTDSGPPPQSSMGRKIRTKKALPPPSPSKVTRRGRRGRRIDSSSDDSD